MSYQRGDSNSLSHPETPESSCCPVLHECCPQPCRHGVGGEGRRHAYPRCQGLATPTLQPQLQAPVPRSPQEGRSGPESTLCQQLLETRQLGSRLSF